MVRLHVQRDGRKHVTCTVSANRLFGSFYGPYRIHYHFAPCSIIIECA